MNFKPDESLLIAYLYGELEGAEKEKVERYLTEHPGAVSELESLGFVRQALGKIADKEVIAPPIVMEDNRSAYFWNAPFVRAVLGVAASLTLLILVGKFTGLTLSYADQALTIGFGETKNNDTNPGAEQPLLTSAEVQEMINASLIKNNEAVQSDWQETQRKMDESIHSALTARSDAVLNELIQKTSVASEEQIRQFALTLQADNARMIKDYLTLNSVDQRKYIETLLVDFAKYMEQQHKNDLQVLQAKVNTIQENTDLFKYETEQILTSIFSSVDNSKSFATKN